MLNKEEEIKKEDKKFLLIAFLIVVIPIFLIGFFYQSYYLGDYVVQEQWINSSYQGYFYCNECLWIKFSAGCNQYPVYFFEEQHEFDNRFKIGDIVNINFKEVNGKYYVRGITKAIKYRTKCN